jgi:hypothetical protein
MGIFVPFGHDFALLKLETGFCDTHMSSIEEIF